VELARSLDKRVNVRVGIINPVDGTISPGQVPTVAPPPPPPPPPPPVGIAPLRVGGLISAPRQTFSVPPIYPPGARTARVQGVVMLEARINRDGSVAVLRVLRSIPLLDTAAVNAVSQWQYEPILLNGVPIDALMTIPVTFTLPPEP
jgi:protein TonB